MFDLFNKKALESEKYRNDVLEKELKDTRKQLEQLEARLRGDRVCDGYCKLCSHGIKRDAFSPLIGNYDTWCCVLDCKCKDFEKKEC